MEQRSLISQSKGRRLHRSFRRVLPILCMQTALLLTAGAVRQLSAQSSLAEDSLALATVCRSQAFEQVIAASPARGLEAREPWCARLFTVSAVGLRPRVVIGLSIGGDFAGRQVAFFGVLEDQVYLLTPPGPAGIDLLVSPNAWNTFLEASPTVRIDGAVTAIQVACLFTGLATRQDLHSDCRGIGSVQARRSEGGWRIKLEPTDADVTITPAALVSAFQAPGLVYAE